jgi:hypothetical protein
MKTTVVHHSADYDGIFCREIARKFIPDAELIGWDFGDKPLPIPSADSKVYVMDLPCDKPFGITFPKKPVAETFTETAPGNAHKDFYNWVWIDHHASAIASHPIDLSGYRIDGVAACRLAWQWFSKDHTDPVVQFNGLPDKQEFIDRQVIEPIAVRLAGEYDIWDKRDPNAELFQHGLRSRDIDSSNWGDSSYWSVMLSQTLEAKALVNDLLISAKYVEYAQKKQDAFIAKNRSFDLQFEGLNFMAINAVRCNSLTFEAAVRPDHDALLGFFWNGKVWTVSMYHAPHRKDLDLSAIAVQYGGGGHRGACGFSVKELPFKL